jgi:hypothetical protein
MLALSGAASGANAMTETGRRTAALCATATRAAEINATVPRGLLTAISLKESGRWDSEKKQSVAWPWTVTAEGSGAHCPRRDLEQIRFEQNRPWRCHDPVKLLYFNDLERIHALSREHEVSALNHDPL